MREICVAGFGNNGIKISRYISSSLSIPSINISSEEGKDIIFIPQERVSLLESEKITTEYDEYFINILNRCRRTDMLAVISDLSDAYSAALTKVLGKFTKKLKIQTLGIFVYPFRSEGNRFEIARTALEVIKENYDLIITLGKDEIFKAFMDIPIKYIDNVQRELAYMIIKNIYESLTPQEYLEIIAKAKKFAGFGVSITDRMDRLAESYDEATSSPWLGIDRGNTMIIFNGNITEKDIDAIKGNILFKNFNIKINMNMKQGRRIDILILNF